MCFCVGEKNSKDLKFLIIQNQVNQFPDKTSSKYHLAIFDNYSDLTVLLVLTVGEREFDETRLRALLKDEPRNVHWCDLRDDVRERVRKEVERKE